VLGELAARSVYESLRVDKPDALTRFLLGHALEREEAHKLHGDADTGGACTEEENAV
jgi:hypothetical protein